MLGGRWPGRLHVLLGILLVVASCRQGATLPAPPSILLLTLDTTRADFLGCYGGSASTPALDRLAADALVFDNLFSVGFGTSPSHASLFTGLYVS